MKRLPILVLFFCTLAPFSFSQAAVLDTGTAVGPKTEVFYSNYQTIGGFAVPMTQSTYADGKLARQLTLTSVTFNSGVPSANFAMSCEVANAQ